MSSRSVSAEFDDDMVVIACGAEAARDPHIPFDGQRVFTSDDEIGKASCREISRGQIIGDRTAMLKFIFSHETHDRQGAHIMGEGANEPLHIGQTLMAHGGRIDDPADAVFNCPTPAECYKTAALDGLNRLSV